VCGVCPPARADEVRGEPGVVFNLFSAPAMSINAAFEAVPLRFRALDITDTTLGSVDLAACSSRGGGRGALRFDVDSGNLSHSGAPLDATYERYECSLASMSCRWVAIGAAAAGGEPAGPRALAQPQLDSGFARVRVEGEGAAATVTRHCMLALDTDIDCAAYAAWPQAVAACFALMRGAAPAEAREEWVMLLTLPLLRPDERFCFMGVDLARVTDEAHGLLGQRATATAELPLGSASISAHGVASAEFGPQGEGAIEGAYLDYQRERLDAHAAPSPYNRFESCSVEGGSVK
jgi:hypothetical protein